MNALRRILAPFNTQRIGAAGVALAGSSTAALIHLLTSADALRALIHHDSATCYGALAAFIGVAIGVAGAYLGMPATVIPPPATPAEKSQP